MDKLYHKFRDAEDKANTKLGEAVRTELHYDGLYGHSGRLITIAELRAFARQMNRGNWDFLFRMLGAIANVLELEQRDRKEETNVDQTNPTG